MSLVDEALAGFRLSSVSSGLTVHVFADGDPTVEVEPLEMTLVPLNLLKNAATAMRRSDATTLAVSVVTEREDEAADVVVRQTPRAWAVFRIADLGPKVSDATIAASSKSARTSRSASCRAFARSLRARGIGRREERSPSRRGR